MYLIYQQTVFGLFPLHNININNQSRTLWINNRIPEKNYTYYEIQNSYSQVIKFLFKQV